MMTKEITIKCQDCGKVIQKEEIEIPCAGCGSLKRQYVAIKSTRLVLKPLQSSEHRRKITFNVLRGIIIITAIAACILATIFPHNRDLVFWTFLGFNILVLIIASIVTSKNSKVKTKLIKDTVGIKVKLGRMDYWIDILKPGATIFLFAFATLYVLLTIVNTTISKPIDFVVVSATLGGLVLAAGAFQSINKPLKERLFQIARLFILATFLLLVFYIMYTVLSSASPDFNPTNYANIDYKWVINEIIFVIAVIGLFGGTYSFSKAIIDLVASLGKDELRVIIE